MSAVTNGNIRPNAKNSAYLERKILYTASPKMIHDRYGELLTIPLHNSDEIVQRIYYNFDENIEKNQTYISETKPFELNESVADAGGRDNVLKYKDVSAKLVELGASFPYTTRLRKFAWDDPVAKGTDKLGKQMGLMADAWMREQHIANTTYSETAFNGSNTGQYVDLTGTWASKSVEFSELLQRTVTDLMDTDLYPVTKIIAPTEKTAIQPVPECYPALIDPIMYEYLRKMEHLGFLPVHKYPNGSGLPGEVGSMGHIRFFMSTHTHRTKSNTTAGFNTYDRHGEYHHILIFTEGTYATVSLKGEGRVKVVHKLPGTSGIADKYDREGAVSAMTWIAYMNMFPHGRKRIAVKLGR